MLYECKIVGIKKVHVNILKRLKIRKKLKYHPLNQFKGHLLH